ncbi:MAG: hypothetical protein LBL79_08590 [Prevotella sp.]|jgi:hypothetical protein|nr:hypothetical protein [Prevotella sp.]
MKHIDINEVYTLFEEIKELVKKGNENKQTVAQPEVQPKIELSDFSVINELTDKLDKTIEEVRKPVKTEHRHIFSLDSSKVFVGVMGSCIVTILCLCTIFYQRKEISSCADNDLKYRYIKMQGETTPREIELLEDIFENNRDKVKPIRKEVEKHEKAVLEEAKRLEKARLKEQEAERLRQEAENLKRKK